MSEEKIKFTDLKLKNDVLEAIDAFGFEYATPIQSQVITPVLAGRDVVGCAQTGTGKTAAFLIPVVDRLLEKKHDAIRCLILAPTRELAIQIEQNLVGLIYNTNITCQSVYGGNQKDNFTEQKQSIRNKVDILVATPGRLIAHINLGYTDLSEIDFFILDEADRMMDMGFMPDVERIVKLTPPLRQSLFFSATMPPEMRRLANAFLSNPKEISVAPPASPAERVQQSRIVVGKRDKRAALFQLLQAEDVKNAIIFCNRKRDVDLLYKALKKEGFNAAAIHGDLAQSVRMETLEGFKSGRISLLVASDVAARGLDVQGLSHVFNYDVPMSAEDYVHRIGRTGRAGQAGRAYMLVTPDDDRYLAAIHSLIRKEIPAESLSGLAASEKVEAETASAEGSSAATDEKPKKRPARSRRRAKTDASEALEAQGAEGEATLAPEDVPAEEPAPKSRRRRGGSAATRKRDESAASPPAGEPADAVGAQGQNEASQESATAAETRETAVSAPDQDGAGKSTAKDARNRTAPDRPRADNAREAAGTTGSPQPRKNEPPARGRRAEGRRRNGRGAGGESRQAESAKPVLGMGDHVPAFMMRPVRRQQG